MSIVTLVEWVSEVEPGITGELLLGMRPSSRERFACFICDEGLDFPFVYWHGPEHDLLLHPKCAKYLGEHLIGDARLATLTQPDRAHLLDNIEMEQARLDRLARSKNEKAAR